MTNTLGAIIVAAGSGTRMAGRDKLFTEVAGRPLLAYAIAPFDDSALVSRIVLVTSQLNLKRGRDLVDREGFSKVEALVQGGARRQDSVRLGLDALGPCDYVAVHDGARPLVSTRLIERGLAAVRDSAAAVPALRIADTVKEVRDSGTVVRTLDRSHLWAIQTPQFFRRDLLERAHHEVTADATDDASMIESLGEPVHIFEGDPQNIKVTVAGDLDMVESLLAKDPTLSR
jgi:2-C-methyl-D-erythritol 4-phosphate cytidylyltransferase